MKAARAVLLLAVTVSLVSRLCFASEQPTPFMAFSLGEAERQLRSWKGAGQDVFALGGITRLAGLVYDRDAHDLIVVGQLDADVQPIGLDDLIVALRALMEHKQAPLVSIDRTSDTSMSGLQSVRLEGGIADTSFGRDLIAADAVLKKLALGTLPTRIWGFESYFDLSVARLSEGENDVRVRFWFYPPDENILSIRQDVAALQTVRVRVRTQLLGAAGNGPAGKTDALGDEFASSFNSHFDDLSAAYPEIGRLNSLFDLVALAQGAVAMDLGTELTYWLRDYSITPARTDTTYPLLSRQATVDSSGRKQIIQVDGGIELKAMVLRLRDGDVTALRDMVLRSRPGNRALKWRLPLQAWTIPGAERNGLGDELSLDGENLGSAQQDIGTSIDRSIRPASSSSATPFPLSGQLGGFGSPFGKGGMPSFTRTMNLAPASNTHNIGGVMLSGGASFEGDQIPGVDLSGGAFSLVLRGGNARVSSDQLRKFMTALWAVYFGNEDPGVSIDPIAPAVEKHLVRYIGNVINTDLGRVMREADYQMKKWAVGTETPAIPGFKDVDDLMGKAGFNYIGASRRFWFVPEEMEFRRGDEMLLFARGRMRLKTQYVLQDKPTEAEPADTEFARFFTENYDEIASKYPAFEQLFEYAKLVSLAQYLKKSNVPLYWYLMANRDLVITEGSPGTVEQLVKGSRHFQGIEIKGGVDLSGAQGRYVYDSDATNAIRNALKRVNPAVPHNRDVTTRRADIGREPVSFDYDRGAFTILPQHTLTSGVDRNGTRYQTDLAMARGQQSGIELVRYMDPSHPSSGEFGRGWHLFVPYRIEPVDENKIEFGNVRYPIRMRLRNLLTRSEEILAFKKDRYAIPGYVPVDEPKSGVIGLFLMTDLSYRLVDKLGDEFQFDGAGYLTEMHLGTNFHARYEYHGGFVDDVEDTQFAIQAGNDERVSFGDLLVPSSLVVLHGTDRETLVFRSKWGIGAYVAPGASDYKKVVPMTDGSFRLEDKQRNELAFDPTGSFVAISPSPHFPRPIKSLQQGDQRLVFRYSIGPDRSLRISRAITEPADTVKSEDAGARFVVSYSYIGDQLAKVEQTSLSHVSEGVRAKSKSSRLAQASRRRTLCIRRMHPSSKDAVPTEGEAVVSLQRDAIGAQVVRVAQ